MPEEKPHTSEEDGKKPAGEPEGKGTPPKPEDAPKFTQEDQDRLAAKIRKEEKAKYDAKAAEAARLAEEAKAAEQGEFKKLAEDRQKELDELKPKLETAESELATYKSKVAEMVANELDALPDEVKDASIAQYAEDKSLTNPLDVLAWLPKGKKLAEALNGSAKPGMKLDPKSNGTPGDPEAEKRARADARRAYRY
jgi:vacuolar-type H+-ATPase subunit I/STV1